MELRSCENCQSFKPIDANMGECRRDPVRILTNVYNPNGGVNLLSGWPQTKKVDWCQQIIPIKQNERPTLRPVS